MFNPENTRYLGRTLAKIAAVNVPLAKKIDENGGFLTSEEVDPLVLVDPSFTVLVRTGQGRFTCRADELKGKLAEIEAKYQEVERTKGSPAVMHGADYVRDVSLPVDDHQKAI